MAGIRIDSVRKQFGRVVAVADVSLDIPDGAFVILVGPSGCGKTTLLRMLAGLEDVSAGRIAIGTREVTTLPARERDVAMVFQSYALYPHMTVRRNMSFALEIKEVPRPEIERRVSATAEILGIAPLLERRPKQLSGGQRQRVALGRAIVREPSVFLFDEPLSNLDAKLRTSMRSELIKLHKRLKATIVYVTHDQVEAMTMGELVVVMKDGVIQQQGAPLDIYRDPANLFVAEFIGSPAMNFLEGRLDAARCEAVTRSGLRLRLQASDRGPIDGADAGMVFGIRPEHLGTEPKPGHDTLEATVEVVEPLGAETILEVSVQGATLTARVKGEIVPAVGAPIRIAVDPRKIYAFRKADGARVRLSGRP
jgi:multiple sugar transport system ATP-binding protein